MKKNKKEKKRMIRLLKERIKSNKTTFAVYIILRTITVGVMIRAIFLGQWESVFTCLLALVLFLVPSFLERKLNITLPSALEIVAFCFVFAVKNCVSFREAHNLYTENI